MEKQPILLRAHHGMCLAFFQGEGYSDLFVAHMGKILEQMQENPSLQIVTHADVICEKCPNLENGSCNTPDLVRAYDQKVLSFCGLEEGTVLTWDTFSKLVSERILLQGKRKEICEHANGVNFVNRKFTPFLNRIVYSIIFSAALSLLIV